MNDATTPCSRCGAETLESRAHFSDNGMICPGCAQKQTMSELDEQGMFVDRVGNPGGNTVLGFVAGFLGGCIGLLLVYVFAKGEDTKKGAMIGFGTQAVLGIAARVVFSA